MFDYIKGILAHSSPSCITIDIQGVGYRLHIPLNNYAALPALGSQVLCYVTAVIREDSHKLFGFLSQHERALFEHLISISGIGSKTALALIGHMEVHDLQTAIHQGNSTQVCKIPGIGKKTAERLIVEMRDKIFKISAAEPSSKSSVVRETGTIADAVSALVHLGYHNLQAQKAVTAAVKSLGKEPELAVLITASLRYM